jgi:CDP-glycerol glycerophosphotransferase (TagB/SpsB family)
MRALALVAHPDDCVIFAWPFIEAHPEFVWTILYMTYTQSSSRGTELNNYWKKRNIPTVFLGFNDDWEFVKNGELGFNAEQANREMVNIGNQYDLILTHFEDGDYGHIHHKFVNTAAKQIDKPKVYFASTFNYNTQYVVQESVAVGELPIHKEVIEQFQDRDIGRYIITPEAELLLKNKNENINIK